MENQLGKPLKPAVPGLNIGDRFTKRLVIGDCDMHCGDAAFLHLPEYLFRPIGILKIVDQMHGLSRYHIFVSAFMLASMRAFQS